jgi:hypothetical protein
MPDLHLSTFETDASPPAGHPLCGGWIKPAERVDDPLLLRGLVVQGAGQPIVLAALDWTGVGDESHRVWTEELAEAARTTPDRVSLHCVHQHNAPFVDGEGNRLLREAGAEPPLFDEAFFRDMVRKSSAALARSLVEARPIDRLRVGKAEVSEVASNRRVIGPDGKILYTRTSSTTDPVARAAPVGTIDPVLRSLSFLRGDRPIARTYFYTTHPMSYYGDGRVTSDFVGLARGRRDREEPGVFHVYLTGCAGNVTAGKYNDGSHPVREVLTDRVHEAMARADETAEDHLLSTLDWRTEPIRLEPRADLDFDQLAAIVSDPKASTVDRNRSAMTCGWLLRVRTGRPILLSKLDLGAAQVLLLPAETFVEYQLDAQKILPDVPLATAAYGDGGPWYIPLDRSFDEGGYEPSVAWVARGTETPYRRAIEKLIGSRG